MSSKRLFASWSRRQSGAEPYYRTGGLLPIDMIDVDASGSDSTNNVEPKVRVHSCRECKCAGSAARAGRAIYVVALHGCDSSTAKSMCRGPAAHPLPLCLHPFADLPPGPPRLQPTAPHASHHYPPRLGPIRPAPPVFPAQRRPPQLLVQSVRPLQ